MLVGYNTSTTHAFRWTPATGMTDLGALPSAGDSSVANDVSADGNLVVGYTSGSSTQPDAFLWDARHGMRSLRSMLIADGIDMSGWSLRYANGISFDGSTVVGLAINPAGEQEAFVVTLPEPGTCALATLAAAACFARRRRRRVTWSKASTTA